LNVADAVEAPMNAIAPRIAVMATLYFAKVLISISFFEQSCRIWIAGWS
jgi:hypothetical protein